MARIKIRGWRWLRDPRGGNPGWKLDQRRLGFAVLSRGWGTAGTSFDGRRVSSDFFHPHSLPLDSRTYTYVYRASVDIVAFEQMRTFGVRWRVDMAVGWFQMILDLQGWIKKEGGIHGKVKWISRDSPSFSSPPFPSVSPISSPILLSFPCFLRTTLCRRISFIRWTRSRENAGKGERRKINLQGRVRRGRKIPREGEFQCGS